MKPKHHYVCHLPRQVARDGFLMDAFTLERKHQEVKRAASNTDNTTEFELSTLARAHTEELRNQASLQCDNGLRGRQVRYDPLASFVADSLEYRGLRVSAGGLVFRGDERFRVMGALLMDEHGLQFLVKPLARIRRLSGIASVWRLEDLQW